MNMIVHCCRELTLGDLVAPDHQIETSNFSGLPRLFFVLYNIIMMIQHNQFRNKKQKKPWYVFVEEY